MPNLHQVEFVVIGAGGLGCPALLGLVAAGALRLHIVEHDVVEASNLQRQILYSLAQVGMAKAKAATWTLQRRCADLQVRRTDRKLCPTEVSDFVASLPRPAVVLECTDAPDIKFAVNDACLRHDVPAVIGAALGLRAQVIAVRSGRACYRCIYEAPPVAEQLPTCESAGVLGPVVGLAGALMASHAIALAQEAPETAGTLTAFHGLHGSIQTLKPRVRPDCPAHGTPASASTPTDSGSRWATA